MTEEQFKLEISYLERERDKNLKIKCKRVADKYQRQINQLKELHANKLKETQIN